MHLVDAGVIASEYALLATYIQQTIVGSTTNLENFAHVTVHSLSLEDLQHYKILP